VVFLLTGLGSATWAGRVPAIQEQLSLSPGALALAVLGLEAGAIAGLPAGGALVARGGSRAVLRASLAAYPAALVAIAFAPTLVALAAALAAMAFANSLADVAMNVHGVELERRTGRRLLSRLHAGHSAGVLAGGLGGTAAATAGVPVTAHFALVAAISIAGGQVAVAALDADGADVAAPRRIGSARAVLDPQLALLGTLAFCTFLLDGAAYGWIAVHMRGEGAAPGLAAAGFTAFALCLAAGRLGGDRLVERYGRGAVVRGGALVAACGTGFALLAPAPALALAGWAALGAGLAPLAPAVLGAAPDASSVPAPQAIAAVTAIGYFGSFTGPPAIGGLAGPLGLTTALGVMVVVALTAAVLSGRALPAARHSAGIGRPVRCSTSG
jgi:MFS family permease